MPFEIVETETKDTMPPTACLTYMRPKPRGGKPMDREKVKPKLIVTLPTVICGVAKSERFVLLMGTGADAGKVRIKGVKKDTKGGIKPTEFKAHMMLRFGHVPKIGKAIFDQMHCPVKRITDEEFEIDAPFLVEASGEED